MKKFIFLILTCSCNPTKPEDPETTVIPTTSAGNPNKCHVCAEMKECSVIGSICDFDEVFTKPAACLELCEKTKLDACGGQPELCAEYQGGLFVCKPDCR